MNNFREELDLLFQLDPPKTAVDIKNAIENMINISYVKQIAYGFRLYTNKTIVSQFTTPYTINDFEIKSGSNYITIRKIMKFEFKKYNMDRFSFGYNGKHGWYDDIYSDILNNKQQGLKDYLSAWINNSINDIDNIKYDEE